MTTLISNPFSVTVSPAAGSTPAWLSGVPLMTWTEIAGTNLNAAQSGFTSPGGNKTYVTSYCGACIKASGSEIFITGGGHADYGGNEVYTLRLGDDAPAWVRRRDPTAVVGSTSVPGNSHYSDGRPAARHTYNDIWYIDSLDRMLLVTANAVWGNGNGNFGTVDAFNPNTNDYLAAGTYADAPSNTQGTSQGRIKDASENIWTFQKSSGVVSRWNVADGSWSVIGTRSVYDSARPFAYDSTRNRVLRPSNGGALYDLSSSAAESNPGINGPAAGSVTGTGSLEYCPDRDSYILCTWSHSFYEIDASTFTATSLSIAGTLGASLAGDGTDQLYGRFGYAPELNGFYLVQSVSQNVWFFRTA